MNKITKVNGGNALNNVETYIQSLSEKANDSVSSALQAQLQVLRYVQTPKLFDSSFDLMLDYSRKSIKYALNEVEKDKIRESIALTTQNYVFFMQARLDYEHACIEDEHSKQREDLRKLVVDGAKMLSTSITTACSLASQKPSGDMLVALEKEIIDKTFSEDESGNSGFFAKVMDWLMKDDRVRERTEIYKKNLREFYSGLDTLVTKLYKYRKVIGESDLISGMIERYSSDMAFNKYSEEYNVAENNISTYKEKLKNWAIYSTGAIFIVHIIVLVIRWIISGLQSLFDEVNEGWAATQWINVSILIVSILLILGVVFGTLILVNKRKQKELDIKITEQKKVYDDYAEAYSFID